MVLCASCLLLIGERWRIPTIVLYIFAGLFLGPVSGLISVSHNMELISEVGILLLLFLVGLELSFEKIKDLGFTVLWAALLQMFLTTLAGAAVCKAFGLSNAASLFIGVALMFSSTVVVVKQLEQAGDTKETYGRLSIGILLVQDLMVILILTIVSALSGQEALDIGQVAKGLGGALFGMMLVLAMALGAAKWVLPKLFEWTSNSPETAFLWSLAWCFCLVAVSEFLHLSPEIGAFLAGMALAQLPYAHHFRRRIHPLTNFFVAIFFITLGVQMNLGEASQFGALPFVLIALVMLLKVFVFVTFLPRLGQSRRTAVLSGISLSQISEFSLIFAALGLSSGLMDSSVLALLSLVALVTMSLSSFLFTARAKLLDVLTARGLLTAQKAEAEGKGLQGHVVLVGVNPLSLAILEHLREHNFEVVVLERDAKKLSELTVASVLGDAEDWESLEDARFREALAVVTTLHIESTNELIAYRCREAGVLCAVHAFDSSVISSLERLQVDYMIRSRVLSTLAIKQELHASGVLDRPSKGLDQ